MTSAAVRGALPNLIVIGAMKGGTSALHYYLDLHPAIAMSRPKELDFFVDGTIATGPDWEFGPEDVRIEKGLESNWSRGPEWYARHFEAGAPVRGEASPSYTAPWYPDVAERMAQLVPDARLIFVVRDPVERTISNYLHQRALGQERRDIEQALGAPRSPYVARSRYALALAPFLGHFPRSQLLVLTQEELRDRRRETVAAAYRFAGVDERFWSPKVERERYSGEARPRRGRVARLLARSPARRVARRLPEDAKRWAERALSAGGPSEMPTPTPELRARLGSYLREDTARLAELTGRGYPAWSTSR